MKPGKADAAVFAVALVASAVVYGVALLGTLISLIV